MATTSLPVAERPNIPVRPNIMTATDNPEHQNSNAPPPASMSRPIASALRERLQPREAPKGEQIPKTAHTNIFIKDMLHPTNCNAHWYAYHQPPVIMALPAS